MTNYNEKIEAAQAPGRGSTTDPTGDQRNAYEPTTVPFGLSGFTAGLDESPWEDAGPAYRQQFEQRHGGSGRRWEEAEPGYRYAHEMNRHPDHQGRDWSEAEPSLRSRYDEWCRECGYQQQESGWDRAKDDVRDAWELVRRR